MKERRSRREFLNTAGLGAAAAAAYPWLGAESSAATQDSPSDAYSPDLIVTNAKVYTMDSRVPQAQSFAVTAGRFVAIGSNDDIKGLAGKRTRWFDAKQMTVVPGFVDTHNHAPGDMLLYSVLVGNPYEVEFVTIAGIVDKLRAKAQQTQPGFWVEGDIFDDTKVKDGRELNIRDLDRVSKDLPVAVHHRGGHTSFYNSKALELAGIAKNSPNPPGGTFDRDAGGELNGRVTDVARRVFAKVGNRPTFTPEQQEQRDRDALAYISKQFVRYGLTSVCHEGGNLSALQQIRDRGELLHRVTYEPDGREVDKMIAAGLRSGFGDDWIRIGPTSEHTCDGSFSERTMALSVPYPGSNPPYKGNVTTTQDDLNAWVERVHRAGFRVNCHANGDVAIAMMLTAYERALNLYPVADTRPKITHCTLVNDELVRRIKAIGCVPALFNTYAYYNPDKFRFYGPQLMSHCMAFRTLLDAGVPASGGSDFPPGPFDPRMAVQAMVTRRGWNGETWGANQRVSVDEALRVNTYNGAYDSHEEMTKGTITPGKLADYVVLADDPHTVDPDKIKDIAIVRTVVGGKAVYQP